MGSGGPDVPNYPWWRCGSHRCQLQVFSSITSAGGGGGWYCAGTTGQTGGSGGGRRLLILMLRGRRSRKYTPYNSPCTQGNDGGWLLLQPPIQLLAEVVEQQLVGSRWPTGGPAGNGGSRSNFSDITVQAQLSRAYFAGGGGGGGNSVDQTWRSRIWWILAVVVLEADLWRTSLSRNLMELLILVVVEVLQVRHQTGVPPATGGSWWFRHSNYKVQISIMSEVKVNKISPRTACGTVTLGDSGDTFTIPSGATITNKFGTANRFWWQQETVVLGYKSSIKTAGFTAVTAATGSGYFCNTTGGIFTIAFTQ